MSKLVHIDESYTKWIEQVRQRYRSSQIKAAFNVNSEMLRFYWSLGQDIVNMNISERWGEGVISRLSKDLTASLGKGFSETSLGYIRRFYLLYSQILTNHPQDGGEIYPQVGGELDVLFLIPWSHHKYIIDKVHGDARKALFFANKTLENQWGRGVLLNFLSTDLYERQGSSQTNFSLTLPAPQSDLAQQMLKSPYNFDFLQLNEKYTESELKDNLISHISRFLLEMGRGFTFVGREYRLPAGGKDKYIDLLLYHIPLHRYCVVEVKTTEVDFPDVGQLAGYVAMVNDLLNTSVEQPAIGLLICKEKNTVLARYALANVSAPIGISEYTTSTKTLPKEVQEALPSTEEIEQELRKEK